VTALPSNGTILLADGVTPVHLGKTLTVRQLTTSSRGQRQRYSCADNKADDIGPDGWRVVGSPPVRFRRPAGILPLAVRSAAHPLINRSGFRSLPGLALLISAH
jgi:hypothetical protein